MAERKMKITASLFEDGLKCVTKCFLRSLGEAGTGNAYAEWVRTKSAFHHTAGIKLLMASVTQDECIRDLSRTGNLKTAEWRFAMDFVASSKNLQTNIHALERIPSDGRGKAAQFIPIRFTLFNKLTKDDKLLLAFDALVLSEVLGLEISLGRIIHGDNFSTLKVKTSALTGEVRKLIRKFDMMLSGVSPSDLVLKRHCGECEYQARCTEKAKEKDDLSLLTNITEKERNRFNSKGIFSVTQLSYTFRPRRRPKRLREKREKYHHALKALAIRQKKIHIVGQPQFNIVGTPVYLDVEGLPDRDFYYLIGLRFKTAGSVKQRSLWADDAKGEEGIWVDFLNILAGIENPILIHYGSFETTFLKRMLKRYGEPLEGTGAVEAITSALNLVSLLFGQIYFPTYSNRLKDLGAYLGFRWSSTNPSGIQSIIWRMDWEQSRNSFAKQKLITYNSEDCHALDILAETLCVFAAQMIK